MIGAQSDSIGTGTGGLESIIGDDSEGPMTQTSLEAKSVFRSIADACAASVVGSIHPSSDGTVCSGSKTRAATGAFS